MAFSAYAGLAWPGCRANIFRPRPEFFRLGCPWPGIIDTLPIITQEDDFLNNDLNE
jgi:hypothetical protein